MENGRFVCAPFRGLGVTYDVHLMLIEMDFLLVLIEHR